MNERRYREPDPAQNQGPQNNPVSCTAIPRSILVVYAHPDDESFGPSAVLATYARLGTAVFGLFATPGQFGQTVPGLEVSPAELAVTRARDLREAAALIGFANVEILPFVDGTLTQLPLAALEKPIFAAMQRYHPQVVLTFGPSGITGHPDHLAVHRATVDAFQRGLTLNLGVQELYYDAVPPAAARDLKLEDVPAGHPNTWIDVAATSAVKLDVLRIHGRHILDAREMAARLVHQLPTESPMFRAWPPVAPGRRLTGFLQDDRK